MALLASYPPSAHAQTDAVTADFVPAEMTFLSSERPRGRLRIFNGSNEPLSFNHVYGTTSEGSSVNGGLAVRELLEIIGTRSSDIVTIPPHTSYENDVSLARCTLLSQPCAVAAELSVNLGRADRTWFTVKTQAHSYDIVADPTATFDDRGLSDNRPLIVVQGESSDVLDLDSLVIEIRPAPSEPWSGSAEPAVIKAARAIAARDGVTIAGTGTSAEAQDSYATITVRRPSAQREQIAKLLADLDRELARRVRSITHHVAFDRFAFEPALGRAAVEAQLEGRRFAELIGVEPLQPSWLAAEDFFAVGDRRNPFSSLDVMKPQGIDYGDVESGPQSVRVRTAVVQAGSRTVAPTIVQAPTIDAEFEGQAVALADWPDIHATIEADRPELFVAAGTDEDSALAAGRVPEQVALAYALRRANMFASLLGARLGIVSMVVLPHVADEFSGVRIRSVGLAMTMEPPNPLSSVVRGAATPSPAPRAGPASPLPFAPIEVAGPDSTITTSARVELPVAPDGLRVEVTVVPTREAPNQATVVAQLKNDPMVSDLAVEGGASSDARVIYRVVLRSAAAAGRARIVDLIRGAYGANARTLNTVETRLIRDCRPLERRVVADAIGQARARAAARAASDHVRLVRLLLAVELPFGADFDGCFDHAAAPELSSLPGYASLDELRVWGAVSLTFRTRSER